MNLHYKNKSNYFISTKVYRRSIILNIKMISQKPLLIKVSRPIWVCPACSDTADHISKLPTTYFWFLYSFSCYHSAQEKCITTRLSHFWLSLLWAVQEKNVGNPKTLFWYRYNTNTCIYNIYTIFTSLTLASISKSYF